MSWNITARKTSPCERARSQHLEWHGDAPDSVGTVGLQPAAHSSHLCWQQPNTMGCHVPGRTPRAACRVGVPPARGTWAGMWLPAARMELLMASPQALDNIPSQHPTRGDKISLHPAGMSHGVPQQYSGAGGQRLTVSCARCPHLEGHPCPTRGTLSAPHSP